MIEIHAVKTWFDKRVGVVDLPDDVLGVVKQIKQMGGGRLHVFFNPQHQGYDIVERCLDGVDRLVFSVDELDQRAVVRLMRADQWGGETPDRGMVKPEGDDFLDQIDRANAALQAKKDAELRDKLNEAGERLAWALDAAGHSVGGQIFLPEEIVRGRTNAQ